MKKLVLTLALTGFLAVLHAQTTSTEPQLDDYVKNYYPESVIERMYNMLKKSQTPMSTARQIQFAEYYKRRDSILTVIIKSSGSDEVLISATNELDSLFETMLTSKERYKYFTYRNYDKRSYPITMSQFSKAVQYHDTLGLSEGVVNTLLEKIEVLRKMKDQFYKFNPGRTFDSRAFESQTMTELLSEDQYTMLLTIKNKRRSYNYALNDWKEMQARQINSSFNMQETLTKLAAYYLNRNNTYDRYMHDKIKQSEAVKIIYEGKPEELTALIKARQSAENDTIGQSYHW